MDPSHALRDTLESMTKVYHEETIPVEFGSPPRAVPEGEHLNGETVAEPTVVVDPAPGEKFNHTLSGPEELRCITNTLSHELEHIRESELTSKETFQQQYPTHADFAGGVLNILEDQYIDYTRTARFPGLKCTEAFVIDTLYQDDDLWPPIHTLEATPKAMLEGLRQVAFCGHAKGIRHAESWLREFLSRVRPHIKQVRRADSQHRRADIAHEVMAIAEEFLPDEDLEMPDTCSVCEEEPPAIVAPMVGPVCEDCAPMGHGSDEQAMSAVQLDSSTSSGDSEPPSAKIDSAATEPPREPSSSGATSTDLGGDSEDSSREPTGAHSDGGMAEGGSDTDGDPSTELSTMDSLARNENIGSWWDVPEDADYRSVSEKDISRFERIQRQRDPTEDFLAELRERRLKAESSPGGVTQNEPQHSSHLSKSEAWRTLRDDHRRTFRKITTHDMPVPSRVGSELNMQNVIQREAGDTSRDKLYEQSQRIARGGRLVAVSADMSGSMDGKQVKLALAAIAEAATMVGDDFLATCWTSASRPRGGYELKRESTGIGLVCGPTEPFEWEHLDSFSTGGQTPTADGVDLTGQLIKGLHAREKLLIVITDGAPNSEYSGSADGMTGSPVGDAHTVVQNHRSKNIKVLGLCVGAAAEDTAMADIFGPEGYVSASMDNLAHELLKVYRRQLRV